MRRPLLRSRRARQRAEDAGLLGGAVAWTLEWLKIDRSFVAPLGEDVADESIVGAIAAMARALGIVIVAEGVEREEQLRSLRLLGIGYAQGYLLDRPTEAERVAAPPDFVALSS
jgi:EAL domain-containing protein (putative c-di-GMP-specific phosphodiesterase class I)